MKTCQSTASSVAGYPESRRKEPYYHASPSEPSSCMSSAGDLGSASTLQSCHQNWTEAIASIAKDVPGGVVLRRGGVTIVHSGLSITAFNCAFVLDPPRTLTGVEKEIAGALARHPQPWCLISTEENRRAIGPIVEALRLQPRDVLPGMIWEPLPRPSHSAPQELEIRRVRDAEDLRIFGRTMMEGFDAPLALMAPWVAGILSKGSLRPTRRSLYLGLVKNRPVCTAIRFTTNRVAGIYGVSTIPEFRRRGFGAAITRRAVLDGGEEGCERSYLQSSKMGRSVYESLGYRTTEEYVLWLPEGPTKR